MNNNNSKTMLGKKELFKVQKDTHFICKTLSLKEFGIQFSRRLKNDMPKICQDFEKVKVGTYCFVNKVAHDLT